MKKSVPVILLSFLITSCSTFNTFKDNSDYYQLVNEKTKGKAVTVTTSNGKEFTVERLNAAPDTVSWVSLKQLSYTVNIRDIKRLDYLNWEYDKSTLIEFTDGRQVSGFNLEQKDSLYTYIANDEVLQRIAIDNIKKVTVTNHVEGGVTGFAIGIVAGAGIGYILSPNEGNSAYKGAITGGIAGIVIGTTIGAVLGLPHNYYFR